jgi:hypothetical protein
VIRRWNGSYADAIIESLEPGHGGSVGAEGVGKAERGVVLHQFVSGAPAAALHDSWALVW